MIRFGKITDLPELKALWKECFADEDAYIDAFFDAMYEDAHVLLEEENGVLAGASFFLPGKIALEDAASKGLRWQEIRYVYALAVYPQYRGRGIAAALLHRAYEAYGAPLIAEPAEEGLIGGFYEPLGFSCNFYLDKTELTLQAENYDLRAAELSETHTDLLAGSLFKPVQAERYCAIRNARFLKKGYVSWPLRHVAFAVTQHRGSGGGAYVLPVDGREEILLCYRETQDIIVTETTLTAQELEQYFLPRIAKQCSRVTVVRKTVTTVRECLTGMSYGLLDVQGYLNLTLD